MKKLYTLPIILCVCALVCLCAYALCYADDSDQSVDGFSLVQYEDGGAKKWELNGTSAEIEDGKVNIDNISALAFGEEATLKLKAKEGSFDREKSVVHLEKNVVAKTTDGTTLTTDSLDWNAETKNVSTAEEINVKKNDFEISGKGAEIDMEGKTVEVKKDVTASITSVPPDYLKKKDDKEQTIITCDGPLEINYKKDRATFLNNVKVEGSEGDIFADRIDLYFNSETRRVKCVVARGNVRIMNGGSVTYSEKAIYLVDEGRVILPKRPKLVINNETSGQ